MLCTEFLNEENYKKILGNFKIILNYRALYYCHKESWYNKNTYMVQFFSIDLMNYKSKCKRKLFGGFDVLSNFYL